MNACRQLISKKYMLATILKNSKIVFGTKVSSVYLAVLTEFPAHFCARLQCAWHGTAAEGPPVERVSRCRHRTAGTWRIRAARPTHFFSKILVRSLSLKSRSAKGSSSAASAMVDERGVESLEGTRSAPPGPRAPFPREDTWRMGSDEGRSPFRPFPARAGPDMALAVLAYAAPTRINRTTLRTPRQPSRGTNAQNHK